MTTALVALGVAVLAFACLGVLLMRDALARLHYVSVGVLAVALVAAAVVARDGASLIAVKAVLVAVFVAATSPILAHATARALHVRRERRR